MIGKYSSMHILIYYIIQPCLCQFQIHDLFVLTAYFGLPYHMHIPTNLEKRRNANMSEHSIYQDIATRTGGDIYIGVVGPVRTGKSTFINRFMEALVLPNIAPGYDRDRARDEMPQSAAGKTVMTTEPKFIPDDAVPLTLDGNASLRVKMIDCVGYLVPDALGTIEEGQPRMVHTPWQEEPIPFR